MKVWSRTVKPGVVASLRWLPTLVQKDKPDGNNDLEGTAKLAMSLGSEKEQLQIFLPENHWISIGHKVSVVFEIILNGQRHLYEWARLSVIGPFTDWSTMSALAIRVQYIGPDGTMKSEYIQGDDSDWQHVDENYAGSLRRYVDASAMLRYFTQRSRDRLRPFEKDIGVAQVKDVVYDHFNANINVIPRQVPANNIAMLPARSDPDQLMAEMRQSGFENVGTFRTGKWFGRKTDGRKRSKCDRCLLLASHRITNARSERVENYAPHSDPLRTGWQPSDMHRM